MYVYLKFKARFHIYFEDESYMATKEFHRPLNYPGPCNFSVLRRYCIIHLQETIVFIKRDRDSKIDWKAVSA